MCSTNEAQEERRDVFESMAYVSSAAVSRITAIIEVAGTDETVPNVAKDRPIAFVRDPPAPKNRCAPPEGVPRLSQTLFTGAVRVQIE